MAKVNGERERVRPNSLHLMFQYKVLDCIKATGEVKCKRFLFDKSVAESDQTKCHGKSVCAEKDERK